MIRRPPRSTLDRSSAASDVYKRQRQGAGHGRGRRAGGVADDREPHGDRRGQQPGDPPVSYTHLRAHETVLDLVCRLLLEKKKIMTPTNPTNKSDTTYTLHIHTVTYSHAATSPRHS